MSMFWIPFVEYWYVNLWPVIKSITCSRRMAAAIQYYPDCCRPDASFMHSTAELFAACSFSPAPLAWIKKLQAILRRTAGKEENSTPELDVGIGDVPAD